ncbi:hypothetical protein COLO4_12806 [Corchorus olitorius]|uniref:Uncharacterized protein n=1 Tax=Corchorus olitorius TaxID=93759 RepID=A0A1R3JZI4_9ROSI|nr:hypothetical protein COLO4_12806 [Corchorus olitorius]
MEERHRKATIDFLTKGKERSKGMKKMETIYGPPPFPQRVCTFWWYCTRLGSFTSKFSQNMLYNKLRVTDGQSHKHSSEQGTSRAKHHGTIQGISSNRQTSKECKAIMAKQNSSKIYNFKQEIQGTSICRNHRPSKISYKYYTHKQ